MNALECVALVTKTLIKHLELRKSEIKSRFIWVKFDAKTFNDKRVLSKKDWHTHLIAIAKHCGCEYVNLLKTDYDTKLMYFFTNPNFVEKSAMEKLQEASYAR